MDQRDLEKIIENETRKIKREHRQKLKELQRKVEKLERREENTENCPQVGDNSLEEDENGISRRQFLKSLGAAGIGAIALSSPVAANSMRITPESIEKDGVPIQEGGLFNTDNFLPLDGSRPVTGDLNFAQTSKINVKESEQIRLDNINGVSLRINTENSQAYIKDEINNQTVFKASEGGDVEIPNGDLKITNNTDQQVLMLPGSIRMFTREEIQVF